MDHARRPYAKPPRKRILGIHDQHHPNTRQHLPKTAGKSHLPHPGRRQPAAPLAAFRPHPPTAGLFHAQLHHGTVRRRSGSQKNYASCIAGDARIGTAVCVYDELGANPPKALPAANHASNPHLQSSFFARTTKFNGGLGDSK